ncbi:MAG: TonB-dependent receptor [Labilithrix sp.]|nr:TonB-dependent receptor [Labilithrix sp.]MBX3225325.1 TonB-dependent receptor [Labilithrix sp.]
MSSRLRAAGALIVLALATFAARPALADARTEARAHFKKGMEAISAGKYDDGISELEKAYEILPHPNVLYNIARAHAEAGNLDKAVETFKKYLETNPPDRDETLAVLKSLEAKIRERDKAQPEPPRPVPDKPTTPEKPSGTPTTPPVTPPPATPSGGPAGDIGAARTEDVFAESIVTASKGAQSPLDAPSSTAVITEQDIRLSGITKIPELLRRLAGVDIMQVTGGQTELSIRGFNQRLANKTLVLVDGRSVYADILGATIWQTLSIGVEDIQRIEIVRGPGSSLYGADAFNGVVNIITKKPGEGRSGLAGAYGSEATTHGSLWATGREGELGWRMAAGYDYLPRWSREVPNGRADVRTGVGDQVESSRTIRLDARGAQRFGKAGTLSFGGGLAQGSLEILGIGTLQDIVLPKFAATDVTTAWTSEHLDARVFWNRLRGDSSLNVNYVGQSLLPSRVEQNIVDGEVVYKGRLEVSADFVNDLRIGAAYRYKDVVWTYLDQDRFEHHYALFLHDELKIAKPISLVADYRLDWVPYLERFQQSPRGAVLLHPSKQSTIRGSVATAFRKPTFLESYLRLPIQLPVAGAGQFSEGVRRDDPSFIVNAERILSAELGYLNQESDVFTIDTALYFNRVSSLIELAATRPLTVADFPTAGTQDIATGLFPVGFGGWDNQCQAYNVYGGEASLRTYPTEGLDIYGNYTLNLVQQDNSGCTPDQLSRIVADQRTSRHKVNAGVQLRTQAGFDGSIDFHFVADQFWAEQVTNFVRQQIEQERFRLSEYALVNARVGYRFLSNQADVGLVGFNVLGLEHRQHPFGQLLGRRVMLQFGYRF